MESEGAEKQTICGRSFESHNWNLDLSGPKSFYANLYRNPSVGCGVWVEEPHCLGCYVDCRLKERKDKSREIS